MISRPMDFQEAKTRLASLSLPSRTHQRLQAILKPRKENMACLSANRTKFDYLYSQSKDQQQQWFTEIIEGICSERSQNQPRQFQIVCDVKMQDYKKAGEKLLVKDGNFTINDQIFFLKYFVVRRSSKHQEVVLTHITNKPNSEIRISHNNSAQLSKIYVKLRRLWILEEVLDIKKSMSNTNRQESVDTIKKISQSHHFQPEQFPKKDLKKSIAEEERINDISVNMTFEQMGLESASLMFERMFPKIDLTQLSYDFGFKIINSNEFSKISRNADGKLRLQLVVNCPKQCLYELLCTPTNYDKFLKTLKTHQVLVKLPEDNSCVFHEVRATSAHILTKELQLVFLRHVFMHKGNIHMFDLSIESSEFSNYWSVKPKIFNLWAFYDYKQGSMLVIQSESTEQKDVLAWFQDLLNVRNYSSFSIKSPSNSYFSLSWIPKKFFGEDDMVLDEIVKNNIPPSMNLIVPELNLVSSPTFKQLESQAPNLKTQVFLKQNENNYVYSEDSQGNVVIPNDYLKVKWIQAPLQTLRDSDLRSLRLNGNFQFWKIDASSGEMFYTDKALLQKQSKVLSYVIKRMGANLIQGKSVTSISLPVTIFEDISFLERLATSHETAPLLLQAAAKQKDPVQRFKKVVVFVYSVSMCYIVMKKPFNPILGQTYMCMIDGCPYFAEQISHHPPISSYLLQGRGYRFYGCIQPRQYLGFNSATGYNHGKNFIQFQDGTSMVFNTSEGQVQGVISGERRFRLKGKNRILDTVNGLYTEITHTDKPGLFSKAVHPLNYISGQIRSLRKPAKNFQQVSTKDFNQHLGKFHGYWNGKLFMDERQVFDIENDPFHRHVNLKFPLPSDPVYRGDVYFKHLQDDDMSQTKKEKLQVIQRNDRQLRKRYGPKKQKH